MTHQSPMRGEIVWDEDTQTYWHRCPTCGEVGELDEHTVDWSSGHATVDASILCECGAHYWIRDGIYQAVR